MDNVIKIGGGGKLYRDAREPEPDKPESAPPAPPPQPQPPWTVSAVTPEVTEVVTGRDWRAVFSTAAEVTGAGMITFGVSMWHLWLGLVVAGIAMLAFGIAMGLPDTPRTK